MIRKIIRLLGFTPTLDLHGFRVREAIAATDAFLSDAAASGEPQVRIIYGKGRGTPGGLGVLRQAVPAWIEQNAMDRVERFERDLDGTGDDGAMRIWMRPDSAARRPAEKGEDA